MTNSNSLHVNGKVDRQQFRQASTRQTRSNECVGDDCSDRADGRRKKNVGERVQVAT